MRTIYLLMMLLPAPLLAQTAADVEVSPPEIRLKIGDQSQVAATGYTESGDVVTNTVFRWSSTDTAVVRVVAGAQASDVGNVVAVAPGAAVIQARTGKIRGFTTVEVTGTAMTAGKPVTESQATVEARRHVAACTALIKPPPPGAWAEWQMPKGNLKLALLGSEPRDAKTYYRFELTNTPANNQPPTVFQLLTPTWPNTGDGLVEVIMQARGRPPVRIAGPRLATTRMHTLSNPARVAASRCREMTDLGMDNVTVPAGTFSARHFRDAEGDYQSWIDPAVPFGLVKVSSKNGGDVVLLGKGTGAVSAISGQPVESPARPGRGRPRTN